MRNYTEIVVILDKSGSMQSIRQGTIGAFNAFVEAQLQHPGEANLTLVTFNENVEPVYHSVDLRAVRMLTSEDYVPNGWTALLDAIGITVTDLGNRLAAKPEYERPAKVIVAILTDGEENSSKRFVKSRIQEMIRHQTEKYSWEFIFLGANMDAVYAGTSLGINARSSFNFAATSKGIGDALNLTSEVIYRSRTA